MVSQWDSATFRDSPSTRATFRLTCAPVRLSLTPRTSEFFVLFARAGENALEVARLVERRFREHPNSGITQEVVKAAETEGDGITRDLIQLLNTQYLTPFDRDDIYMLAIEIDDVVDELEEASDLLGLYGIELPTKHAVQQTGRLGSPRPGLRVPSHVGDRRLGARHGRGTYAGGWRIIKTLGQRIAKIDPAQGFAAQTACASILWGTAHFGFPVSTTHTISGSVLGAGAVRGFHAVRWGVAGNILVAWILTIPAAALVGAFMELVTRLPGGHMIVFVLAILIAAAAFLARRFERRKLLPPATPVQGFGRDRIAAALRRDECSAASSVGAGQCEASVNSWNSPVTTNSVCSPMSTALSPIRSRQREATIIRMPHSVASGELSISRTLSTTRRFVRSISSSSSTSDRARSTSRGREGVERDTHHGLCAIAHLTEPLDEIVPLLEARGELRQLRDRHRLIADPLEMDGVVEHGENETQVGRNRRLLREQLLDRPLDGVVPAVDLVVVGDDLVAQLDVLRLERVDGRAHGAKHHCAFLLKARLQGFEALLVLDAWHQPNLPVT